MLFMLLPARRRVITLARVNLEPGRPHRPRPRTPVQLRDQV